MDDLEIILRHKNARLFKAWYPTAKTNNPCPRCGHYLYSYKFSNYRRFKSCGYCNYDNWPEKIISLIKWMYRRGRIEEVKSQQIDCAINYIKGLKVLKAKPQ